MPDPKDRDAPRGARAMRTAPVHDPRRSDPLLALVRAAREGDRRAFERLVRGQIERVYSILFRVVGSHEDAEDLAQEVFVRAFESLDRYREEGSFEGWLGRIALRIGIDHLRRRDARPAIHAREDELVRALDLRGPERAFDGKELQLHLQSCLERLPQNLRIALVLRVLEGLDYDQIAEATGLRPGTIRTQVMKARRLLTRWLGPWLDDGGRDDD